MLQTSTLVQLPPCTAAAPLTLIETYKTTAPNYAEWVQWGEEILTTGIFAIIICGTLGVLAIYALAPRLLEKASLKF